MLNVFLIGYSSVAITYITSKSQDPSHDYLFPTSVFFFAL